MNLPPSIQASIRQKLSKRFSGADNLKISSIGGGCINDTYRLTFSNNQFFCKTNSASEFPQLFEKEKNGLELIQKQAVIKVPEVIDCFEEDGYQVLLLEWIR